MNPKLNKEYYQELASHFSILSVCDDPCEICNELLHTFKNLFIAKNQEEALNIFKNEQVDVIFINVDTPEINWLGLVNEFRKQKYDIPICILTPIDNAERLATALTLGITQCIFKPIDKDRLEVVLYDIVKKLKYELDAKELAYKKEEEKLQRLVSSNIDSIIKDIPFPMVIFNDEDVLFINKQMKVLLENKHITYEKVSLKEIGNIFENFEDSMAFNKLSNGKHFETQYQYQDKTLKRVFIPTKYSIELNHGSSECFCVVLNDIAPLLMQIKVMQYQQNKVETYKSLIEKLLVKNLFKENKTSLKELTEQDTTSFNSSSSLNLDEVDESILRKSITNKLTAKEYVEELDIEIYEEIRELEGTEGELQAAIDSFTYSPDEENVKEVAKLFGIYGHIVTSLLEFIDLGHAICSLRDFINSLSMEEVEKMSSYYGIQFGLILDDLVQWRTTIFEKQDTLDIHYLDSSLFSSILQLQLDESDDEGDLELF